MSVSFALREHSPGIQPFVTHINMNGSNDCKGYIDKLEFKGTNYSPFPLQDYGFASDVVPSPTNGLLAAGVPMTQIFLSDGLEILSNNFVQTLPHLSGVTNLAGYMCWGEHSSLGV